MRLNKKRWFILALIVGVIIVIPPIIFTIKFFSVPLSSDISDWGAFGDYIGGILNPIIALTGTLILGYLSYQISKQSADENKNLFLFEQRMLAFKRVSFLFNEVQGAINNGSIFSMVSSKFKSVTEEEELSKKALDNYEKILMAVSKINVELKCFPLNFGHLFTYDFNSKEYKSLVKMFEEYFKSLDKPEEALNSETHTANEIKLIKDLRFFAAELKKEITED